MNNLLKKLSRADRHDRREDLEREAAERIKEVGGQAPPEAYASSSATAGSPPPPAPVETGTGATAGPAAGRRLTVQERVAARELQNR